MNTQDFVEQYEDMLDYREFQVIPMAGKNTLMKITTSDEVMAPDCIEMWTPDEVAFSHVCDFHAVIFVRVN